MNQLAAALWADAMRLVGRLQTRGLDIHEGRKLERLIHARMREAVSMLRQVLREAPRARLARLRLAYYLRLVDPAASVEHFQRLLRSGGPDSATIKQDLAAVLVALGRFAAAAELVEPSPTDPKACLLALTVAWRTAKPVWAGRLFPCAARAMSQTQRAEAWAHLAAFQPDPVAWYRRFKSSRPGVRKALDLLAGMGRLQAARSLADAAGLSWAATSNQASCASRLSGLAGYCAFLAGPDKVGGRVQVTWGSHCRVEGASQRFEQCFCEAGKECRDEACNRVLILRFGRPAPGRRDTRAGQSGK